MIARFGGGGKVGCHIGRWKTSGLRITRCKGAMEEGKGLSAKQLQLFGTLGSRKDSDLT
jgi:hypothetical protein